MSNIVNPHPRNGRPRIARIKRIQAHVNVKDLPLILLKSAISPCRLSCRGNILRKCSCSVVFIQAYINLMKRLGLRSIVNPISVTAPLLTSTFHRCWQKIFNKETNQLSTHRINIYDILAETFLHFLTLFRSFARKHKAMFFNTAQTTWAIFPLTVYVGDDSPFLVTCGDYRKRNQPTPHYAWLWTLMQAVNRT